MMPGKWLNKPVRDLTIEDALEAYKEGVIFVCGDGKLRQITSEPKVAPWKDYVAMWRD